LSTLGSKEGFANMAQAITAPGDVILCPNPTYPIHAFGFIMSGGVIRSLDVVPDDSFFAPLERAVRHSIPKPLALILNYPSNPTSYVATLDFYKDVIAFARKHDIIVLSDLAYSEIYFDDNPPPSVLEVPGAMDICVEFTSMSKTFSMPGWRMGFAVGNERLISALTRVKSYLDYGAFTPIQVAATAALNGDGSDIEEVRSIYQTPSRCSGRQFWQGGLAGAVAAGDDVRLVADSRSRSRRWARLEFSKLLVEKADVAVAPGVGFGEHGDEHVRIALVENEHRIRQAARNIKRFLSAAGNADNVVSLSARR
jgi:alanine-synthesizing transaminase